MVPQGWDIGPPSPMGPFLGPVGTPDTMGISTKCPWSLSLNSTSLVSIKVGNHPLFVLLLSSLFSSPSYAINSAATAASIKPATAIGNYKYKFPFFPIFPFFSLFIPVPPSPNLVKSSRKGTTADTWVRSTRTTEKGGGVFLL